MNYVCSDRGTEQCPCHLIAAGQCYTCTMVKEGRCSCEDRAGWQGTCPYSEYMHQGGILRSAPWDQPRDFRILSKTSFASDLAVIRVEASPGLVQQCCRAGTYMMAEAFGWRTPLSVLRSESGFLEFLVKNAGVKTGYLMEAAEREHVWYMTGPYYNGLPGSEQMKELPELIIARGVAAAPLVHMLEGAELPDYCILYLDDEGLPESFLQDYLEGIPYERISLRNEEMQRSLRGLIRKNAEEEKMILLLVSPYYADLLCSSLSEAERALVIRPNPANLCCAMGLCGSCSYTDGDGVTVKLCKCSRHMIK